MVLGIGSISRIWIPVSICSMMRKASSLGCNVGAGQCPLESIPSNQEVVFVNIPICPRELPNTSLVLGELNNDKENENGNEGKQEDKDEIAIGSIWRAIDITIEDFFGVPMAMVDLQLPTSSANSRDTDVRRVTL